jgi:predicted MFS family arabinose efflux permease
LTASALLQNRWLVVVASLLGLLGGGSTIVFIFSVFLNPVTAEFGWSRGTLSAAFGIGGIMAAIATPLIGRLIDIYGARAVVLPGMVLFATSLAALSLLNGSLTLLFALYIVVQLLAATQSPLPYSKVISGWFDRQRGFALGVAIVGTGLGAAIMPPIAQALIDHAGWRVAYVGIALVVFVVAFPATALFLRNPPQEVDATTRKILVPGLTATQALRTPRFWVLTVALFLAMTSVQGVISQATPLLTDRGVAVGTAVRTLSILGLVTIISRVLVGFCLDYFTGPEVGAAFFGASLVGLLGLAFGSGSTASIVGVILCGVAIGAELDIIAYYVGRYFGLRAFGTIYGFMFPVIPIGVGFGAFVMGAVFDRAHTYVPALIAFAIAMALSILLILRLGPYVYVSAPSRAE